MQTGAWLWGTFLSKGDTVIAFSRFSRVLERQMTMNCHIAFHQGVARKKRAAFSGKSSVQSIKLKSSAPKACNRREKQTRSSARPHNPFRFTGDTDFNTHSRLEYGPPGPWLLLSESVLRNTSTASGSARKACSCFIVNNLE